MTCCTGSAPGTAEGFSPLPSAYIEMVPFQLTDASLTAALDEIPAVAGRPRRLLRDRIPAVEKGYRAFGREVTPSDNPVEAGLLFACKLKTDIAFLGRAAVEKVKAEGPRKKLVGFKVDSAEAMLWGGELILRDGAVAGQVTSAAWGETLGSCVGLAYVRRSDASALTPDWVSTGNYEINVGGTSYPISVSLRPLYDPTNARIRPPT